MSQSDKQWKRAPSIAEVRALGQPREILERVGDEHWTGHLYMRRISPFFSWLAVRARVSANAVTMTMIVIGLGGVASAAFPGVATAILAVGLIQIYLLLDCVDGEVARFTHEASARGVYLDRLGHYVVEGGLIAALGVRVAQGDLAWVVLGLAGAISVLLEKVETDLVAAARLRSGLGSAPAGAVEPQRQGLAKARSMSRRFPIHMITHAAEASLLILIAAVVDHYAFDEPLASRGLLIGMLAVTAAVVVLHLISIWSSHRLDA